MVETVYLPWHVKRDPATGEVAMRTMFPDDQGAQLARLAWLISSANAGARNAPLAECAGWDDLYTPTGNP
jgi:hypothetical protein